MKNIVCFSGGKDSTALLLWAKVNLSEFTPVFCDTGWEHPITYGYIDYINEKVLDGELVTISSERYPGGFRECVLDHGMIPGRVTRFCTEDLKIEPLHRFFADLDDGDVHSYQGIRADESQSRRAMEETQWCDEAGGYTIHRPLLRWTVEQVFALLKERGVEPNPLYKLGAGRVGCFPCILINLRELKALLKATPELKTKIKNLEEELRGIQEAKRAAREASGVALKPKQVRKWPSTFFRAGYIPTRFCAFKGRNEKGEVVGVPTADEVFEYIESVDRDQLPLLPQSSCMSIYNLCE